MKDESGFSLLEIILAMALLILISAFFVGAYATYYSMIHRGREVTVQTFEAQEDIEYYIINVEEGEVTEVKDYNVFGRTVTGKTIEQYIQGNRIFYTYVSDLEMLTPAAPQITDAVVKAYSGPGSNTQTYPWTGSELRAEYVDTDPNIYGIILRWYESGEENGSFVIDPRFPGNYLKVKEDWEPLTGKILSQSYTVNPGRYIVFGATPFSAVGKLGREARSSEKQILIMNNPNTEWGNFIEEAYLDQFGIGNLLKRNDYTDLYIYTTLNQEELTLNVELQDTVKKEGSFIYAEIPSNENNDLEAIIEVKVDKEIFLLSGENIGYGIFIGEATLEGKEIKGMMLEFDAGNNRVLLKEMLNGSYNTSFVVDPVSLPTGFVWTEEHTLEIGFFKSDGKILIDFDGKDENGNPIQHPIVFDDLVINHDYDYLGLKTWSEVAHIDESNEIQLGVKNLSAHFYNIAYNLVF